MFIVPDKLTAAAFALVVLFAVMGMAVLFYICAMTTRTEKVHNILSLATQNYAVALVVIF